MVKEKNNGTRNASESCPHKDGFFVADTTVPSAGALSVVVTADGSQTVQGPYGETYHSMGGALLESEYVYKHCGLQYFIRENKAVNTLPPTIHILETGLGTGLNAWLAYRTLQEENHAFSLFYSAIEKYPLPPSVTDQLTYTASAQEEDVWAAIHSGPWHTPYAPGYGFTILKYNCDVLDYGSKVPVSQKIHVVFYDLFSPAVQPELWTEETLKNIVPHLATGAVLTTYSCTGSFRRLLDKMGFITERLPGPGAKRQILRAVFQKPYDTGSVI